MRYSVRAEGSSEALLSSEEGGSVVLVGSGQPMKAFTAALKTMKQGERASLKIKPECEASHHGSLLADFCDHAALRPGRGASSCAYHSYACSRQTGSALVPANLCALAPHHVRLALISAAGRSATCRNKSKFVSSLT